MKKNVSTTTKRIYKGLLLGVLAVLAFVLKVQNPEAPERLMEPAFADVPSPSDGPMDANDSDSDCPNDGPSDCDS